MSRKEAKTSVSSYCSRCVTVSTDWQFLAVSESFLGFLGSKNHVDAIFSMRGFTKKNFSSKCQFWEKMMPAPPRSKLVQRIWGCRHIQYSSMMQKIGFVFLGNWFRVTDLLLGTVTIFILVFSGDFTFMDLDKIIHFISKLSSLLR